MAAKVVAKTGITREPGYLYFVNKDGDVARAKASVGGKKGGGKKEVVAKAGVTKQKGCMYFVDKKGNIAEVAMNRKGGKKKPKSKLAKPTEKYVVYTVTGKSGDLYKSKKVSLPSAVRGIAVGKPTTSKGQYGVKLSYEAKVGNFYKKADKFVSLQKPASAVRVVNDVPKKYQ
ncbi:MAG: hypothetical protein ACMXYK_03015 [Candidatus Woesearchaeota archaeon]